MPAARTGKLAALHAPFGFDPGERWEYGINIDIAGRMVEVASGQDLETYIHEHLFRPLGMRDTGFVIKPQWQDRMAQVHTRDARRRAVADGSGAAGRKIPSSTRAAADCSPHRTII